MDLLCKCKHLPGAAYSSPRLPSLALPFSLALAVSPGALHCPPVLWILLQTTELWYREWQVHGGDTRHFVVKEDS